MDAVSPRLPWQNLKRLRTQGLHVFDVHYEELPEKIVNGLSRTEVYQATQHENQAV
jgi:hypothetical protein